MKYPQPQLLITNLGTTPRVKFLVRSLVVLGMCSGFTIPAFADITTGGDGTMVSPAPGSQPNTINITGGTPQGTNLFHSFGTFNLNSSQVANFQPSVEVTNILGRVTGGEPSSIDGRIQVIGGSPNGVNLYLMNPAGIVFGKNASLDVNGAFTATTAKAIGFGDGKWFNALGTNNYTGLTGNPDGFAFTNTPGSIFSAATFDATNSDLTKRTTRAGQSITLVGGTVISTGDIKTQGGNISIATVEGGKYVQIKADGSILRLDLPASAANINGAKTFTALSLPDLLTNTTGVDLTATVVTVDPKTKVVTLVGDPTAIANAIAGGDTVSKQNRSVSSGDVVTRNLDASSSMSNQGGKIQIESSQAILTGVIDTSVAYDSSGTTAARSQTNSGNVVLNAQTQIKTEKIYSGDAQGTSRTGGNITLSTQTGDIIVDSINTSVTTGGSLYKSRADILGLVGGDITINAAGLFRAIDALDDRTGSYATRSIYAEIFGKINIKHGSKSFVTGVEGEPKFIDGIFFYTPTLKSGFTFPDGASGSRGSIVTSSSSNGSAIVVFKDGIFQDLTKSGISLDGLKITGKVDVDPDPKVAPSNPDTQAARQKSKDNCNPNSTPVAANPIAATTRSSGKAISPSVDPCKSKVGTGKILQVLTDKK
jgi:filamentous hemagglutinin family protein